MSMMQESARAAAQSPLDSAHGACAQEINLLAEAIRELSVRLSPVLREEDESKVSELDGIPHESGESTVVSFVRDQQASAMGMRRKVEGLLRRLDV